MLIDESHVTVPQVRAMYNGDRARKNTLVDYGFRLPSAYDKAMKDYKPIIDPKVDNNLKNKIREYIDNL